MKREERRVPICEYVFDNLNEKGELPDNFSLDYYKSDPKDGGIPFAPGAEDGIYLYHVMHQKLDANSLEDMKKVCEDLFYNPDEEKTEKIVKKFAKKHRAITVIDEFESYIAQNLKIEAVENVIKNAVHIVLKSFDIETVKYGLMVLEVVELGNITEEMKDLFRALGACDEFTLFSVYNMNWWKKDKNKEIFELAKKVKGWGRIHAVSELEPDTEEIKEWLWLEGWKNEVMCEYSAKVCFEKSGAREVWENEEEVSKLSHEKRVALEQMWEYMHSEHSPV